VHMFGEPSPSPDADEQTQPTILAGQARQTVIA
jgi:hypothetical protein